VNILSGEFVLFPKLHIGFLLNFITCIHTESCQVNLIFNYSITLTLQEAEIELYQILQKCP